MSNQCNQLMGESFTALLPPIYQQTLRSAGTIGAEWFRLCAVHHKSIWAYVYVSRSWVDQYQRISNGATVNETASNTPVPPLPVDPQDDDDPLLVSPGLLTHSGSILLNCDLVMETSPRGVEGPVSTFHHHPVLIVNWHRLLEMKNLPVFRRTVRVAASAPFVQVMDGARVSSEAVSAVSFLRIAALHVAMSPSEDAPLITQPPSSIIDTHRLQRVTMDAFINVTTIGDDFMRGCGTLQSMDLTFASKVVSVGSGFMTGCGAIKSIDLSPLGCVTSVGNGFLSESGVEDIDLRGLCGVKKVGNQFMAKCNGLASIAGLEIWTSLSSMGSGFLNSCSALKEVVLFPLRTFLTNSPAPTISSLLLSHCTSLKRVRFADSDVGSTLNPLRIKCNVLDHCNALESVEFDCGEEYTVVEIGTGFIAHATALKEINLSSIINLHTVGDTFLNGCTNLETVKLSTSHRVSEPPASD